MYVFCFPLLVRVGRKGKLKLPAWQLLPATQIQLLSQTASYSMGAVNY